MNKHNPDTNQRKISTQLGPEILKRNKIRTHQTDWIKSQDQMRAELDERHERLRRLDKQYKIALTAALIFAALDVIVIVYALAIVTT